MNLNKRLSKVVGSLLFIGFLLFLLFIVVNALFAFGLGGVSNVVEVLIYVGLPSLLAVVSLYLFFSAMREGRDELFGLRFRSLLVFMLTVVLAGFSYVYDWVSYWLVLVLGFGLFAFTEYSIRQKLQGQPLNQDDGNSEIVFSPTMSTGVAAEEVEGNTTAVLLMWFIGAPYLLFVVWYSLIILSLLRYEFEVFLLITFLPVVLSMILVAKKLYQSLGGCTWKMFKSAFLFGLFGFFSSQLLMFSGGAFTQDRYDIGSAI